MPSDMHPSHLTTLEGLECGTDDALAGRQVPATCADSISLHGCLTMQQSLPACKADSPHSAQSPDAPTTDVIDGKWQVLDSWGPVRSLQKLDSHALRELSWSCSDEDLRSGASSEAGRDLLFSKTWSDNGDTPLVSLAFQQPPIVAMPSGPSPPLRRTRSAPLATAVPLDSVAILYKARRGALQLLDPDSTDSLLPSSGRRSGETSFWGDFKQDRRLRNLAKDAGSIEASRELEQAAQSVPGLMLEPISEPGLTRTPRLPCDSARDHTGAHYGGLSAPPARVASESPRAAPARTKPLDEQLAEHRRASAAARMLARCTNPLRRNLPSCARLAAAAASFIIITLAVSLWVVAHFRESDAAAWEARSGGVAGSSLLSEPWLNAGPLDSTAGGGNTRRCENPVEAWKWQGMELHTDTPMCREICLESPPAALAAASATNRCSDPRSHACVAALVAQADPGPMPSPPPRQTRAQQAPDHMRLANSAPQQSADTQTRAIAAQRSLDGSKPARAQDLNTAEVRSARASSKGATATRYSTLERLATGLLAAPLHAASALQSVLAQIWEYVWWTLFASCALATLSTAVVRQAARCDPQQGGASHAAGLASDAHASTGAGHPSATDPTRVIASNAHAPQDVQPNVPIAASFASQTAFSCDPPSSNAPTATVHGAIAHGDQDSPAADASIAPADDANTIHPHDAGELRDAGVSCRVPEVRTRCASGCQALSHRSSTGRAPSRDSGSLLGDVSTPTSALERGDSASDIIHTLATVSQKVSVPAWSPGPEPAASDGAHAAAPGHADASTESAPPASDEAIDTALDGSLVASRVLPPSAGQLPPAAPLGDRDGATAQSDAAASGALKLKPKADVAAVSVALDDAAPCTATPDVGSIVSPLPDYAASCAATPEMDSGVPAQQPAVSAMLDEAASSAAAPLAYSNVSAQADDAAPRATPPEADSGRSPLDDAAPGLVISEADSDVAAASKTLDDAAPGTALPEADALVSAHADDAAPCAAPPEADSGSSPLDGAAPGVLLPAADSDIAAASAMHDDAAIPAAHADANAPLDDAAPCAAVLEAHSDVSTPLDVAASCSAAVEVEPCAAAIGARLNDAASHAAAPAADCVSSALESTTSGAEIPEAEPEVAASTVLFYDAATSAGVQQADSPVAVVSLPLDAAETDAVTFADVDAASASSPTHHRAAPLAVSAPPEDSACMAEFPASLSTQTDLQGVNGGAIAVESHTPAGCAYNPAHETLVDLGTLAAAPYTAAHLAARHSANVSSETCPERAASGEGELDARSTRMSSPAAVLEEAVAAAQVSASRPDGLQEAANLVPAAASLADDLVEAAGEEWLAAARPDDMAEAADAAQAAAASLGGLEEAADAAPGAALPADGSEEAAGAAQVSAPPSLDLVDPADAAPGPASPPRDPHILSHETVTSGAAFGSVLLLPTDLSPLPLPPPPVRGSISSAEATPRESDDACQSPSPRSQHDSLASNETESAAAARGDCQAPSDRGVSDSASCGSSSAPDARIRGPIVAPHTAGAADGADCEAAAKAEWALHLRRVRPGLLTCPAGEFPGTAPNSDRSAPSPPNTPPPPVSLPKEAHVSVQELCRRYMELVSKRTDAGPPPPSPQARVRTLSMPIGNASPALSPTALHASAHSSSNLDRSNAAESSAAAARDTKSSSKREPRCLSSPPMRTWDAPVPEEPQDAVDGTDSTVGAVVSIIGMQVPDADADTLAVAPANAALPPLSTTSFSPEAAAALEASHATSGAAVSTRAPVLEEAAEDATARTDSRSDSRRESLSTTFSISARLSFASPFDESPAELSGDVDADSPHDMVEDRLEATLEEASAAPLVPPNIAPCVAAPHEAVLSVRAASMDTSECSARDGASTAMAESPRASLACIATLDDAPGSPASSGCTPSFTAQRSASTDACASPDASPRSELRSSSPQATSPGDTQCSVDASLADPSANATTTSPSAEALAADFTHTSSSSGSISGDADSLAAVERASETLLDLSSAAQSTQTTELHTPCQATVSAEEPPLSTAHECTSPHVVVCRDAPLSACSSDVAGTPPSRDAGRVTPSKRARDGGIDMHALKSRFEELQRLAGSLGGVRRSFELRRASKPQPNAAPLHAGARSAPQSVFGGSDASSNRSATVQPACDASRITTSGLSSPADVDAWLRSTPSTASSPAQAPRPPSSCTPPPDAAPHSPARTRSYATSSSENLDLGEALAVPVPDDGAVVSPRDENAAQLLGEGGTRSAASGCTEGAVGSAAPVTEALAARSSLSSELWLPPAVRDGAAEIMRALQGDAAPSESPSDSQAWFADTPSRGPDTADACYTATASVTNESAEVSRAPSEYARSLHDADMAPALEEAASSFPPRALAANTETTSADAHSQACGADAGLNHATDRLHRSQLQSPQALTHDDADAEAHAHQDAAMFSVLAEPQATLSPAMQPRQPAAASPEPWLPDCGCAVFLNDAPPAEAASHGASDSAAEMPLDSDAQPPDPPPAFDEPPSKLSPVLAPSPPSPELPDALDKAPISPVSGAMDSSEPFLLRGRIIGHVGSSADPTSGIVSVALPRLLPSARTSQSGEGLTGTEDHDLDNCDLPSARTDVASLSPRDGAEVPRRYQHLMRPVAFVCDSETLSLTDSCDDMGNDEALSQPLSQSMPRDDAVFEEGDDFAMYSGSLFGDEDTDDEDDMINDWDEGDGSTESLPLVEPEPSYRRPPPMLPFSSQKGYTILAAGLGACLHAFEVTGLDKVLADGGEYTVFAPSNSAFATLLSNGFTPFDKLTNDGMAGLRAVLQLHIVTGSFPAAHLLHLQQQDTLFPRKGSSFRLSTFISPHGGVFIRAGATSSAEVVVPDFAATNAFHGCIVHVVDAVLLPTRPVPKAPTPTRTYAARPPKPPTPTRGSPRAPSQASPGPSSAPSSSSSSPVPPWSNELPLGRVLGRDYIRLPPPPFSKLSQGMK